MVMARNAGLMLTLFSGLIVAGGVPFRQPRTQADEPPMPAVAQGRLQGRFIAADTGKPVAGTKLRVLIEGVPGKDKVAEVISGADGRYSLNVPLGHISMWGVHAPAGYYTQDPKTYGAMLTTAAEPQIVRDFVLQPGAAWRVEVQGTTIPAERPAYFTSLPDPDANPNGYANSADIIAVTGEARGKGVLTVPPDGRFQFACGLVHAPRSYEIPTADVMMEKGFDPTKIKGMPEPDAEHRGAKRLRDEAGRSAVVNGVEVLVEEGRAVLRFAAKAVPAAEALVLRGIAIDEGGKAIEGVKFTAAFLSARGGAMSELQATTNAQGVFELKNVLLPLTQFQDDSRVQMLAVKSGYEGAQSEDLNLLKVKKTGSGDFGAVTMKPGHTLRGKVVDEKGQPVQGAVLINRTNYFLYSHLACRTDAKGQFAMPDLPFRPHSIWVRYGDKYANLDVDFDAKSEECVITLRPNPKPVGGGPPPVPGRLPPPAR